MNIQIQNTENAPMQIDTKAIERKIYGHGYGFLFSDLLSHSLLGYRGACFGPSFCLVHDHVYQKVETQNKYSAQLCAIDFLIRSTIGLDVLSSIEFDHPVTTISIDILNYLHTIETDEYN